MLYYIWIDLIRQNWLWKWYLDNISLISDIDDYSILASETQERMLLISNSDNLHDIEEILIKWDLEYNVIGNVTYLGTYNVYNDNNLIYYKDFNHFPDEDNDLELKEKIYKLST